MYLLALFACSSNLRRFSARCSGLMWSTINLRNSKLKASSPFKTGVSLIGLAIILNYPLVHAAKIKHFRETTKYLER